MEKVKICCEKCNGTGKIDLPKHLSDTLQIYRNTALELSAEKLCCFFSDINSTTLHNRIKALLVLGLLKKGRKEGRTQFYKLA